MSDLARSEWQCNGQLGQFNDYTKLGPPREPVEAGLSLFCEGEQE